MNRTLANVAVIEINQAGFLASDEMGIPHRSPSKVEIGSGELFHVNQRFVNEIQCWRGDRFAGWTVDSIRDRFGVEHDRERAILIRVVSIRATPVRVVSPTGPPLNVLFRKRVVVRSHMHSHIVLEGVAFD